MPSRDTRHNSHAHTLLSITDTPFFPGDEYFKNPSLIFEQHNITPVHEWFDSDEHDTITDIENKHPAETVDAVLVHRLHVLAQLIDENAYPDTPILVGGHLLPRAHSKTDWKHAVESGRELYLFTGSVRSARGYSGYGNTNVNWVLAPIMGLSEHVKLNPEFHPSIEKKYDIGFFSVQTIDKRPHQVLLAAQSIAAELDREITVWIAGPVEDQAYADIMKTLTRNCPNNVSIEHLGFMENPELFKRVQQTKAMYLPAVYAGETTCYAAWETVSYDTPLIGADWGGIGEAARHATHPKSQPVPLTPIPGVKALFPDGFTDTHKHLFNTTDFNHSLTRFSVDHQAAVTALTDAIQFNHNSYDREFTIPDRVHVEATVTAMKDICRGTLPHLPTSTAERNTLGVHTPDEKRYSMLVDPYLSNTYALQMLQDPAIENRE